MKTIGASPLVLRTDRPVGHEVHLDLHAAVVGDEGPELSKRGTNNVEA